MKTVWVTKAPRGPAYVDLRVSRLMRLSRMAATLQ
jgi:hypothetical protein